jgi:hypothetical protein
VVELEVMPMQDTEWMALTRRVQGLGEGTGSVWGKMSPAQMLVHCRLQLECGLGRYPVTRGDNFFTRSVMKWMLFALPWPKGKAETHPDFKVLERKLPVRSLSEEKAALAEVMDQFGKGGFTIFPHPVLGPMDWPTWVKFQKKHLDHHLRQFGA